MARDPYQILGVKKTASLDEIKKAYRSLAKKHHPDLNPGNKQNEEKFKEISHAFDQIGTSEAKGKFDRGETEDNPFQQDAHGTHWSSYYNTQQDHGRYSQNFANSFGGEDFFEQLFGHTSHSTRGTKGPRSPFREENEDVHYQMDISFRDSVLGTEKIITLPHTKALKVKIPPGIESGTNLRFKAQGPRDYQSAPPGDVYIQIKILPEEGWGRNGDDIEMELPINFMEAVLGAQVSVPTMHGPVMMKIPSGVSTGTKLRIKGKGILTEKKQGNQIVRLKVVTPSHPSAEMVQELKKLKERLDYNPRESGT